MSYNHCLHKYNISSYSAAGFYLTVVNNYQQKLL